jgi:hypothetical protein
MTTNWMSDGFDVNPCATHWTNGGTGVTNFTEDMRPVYVEAVKRHGDPDIRVHEKSFGAGNENYGGSLHNHGKRKDLSPFWDVFDAVKKELSHAR